MCSNGARAFSCSGLEIWNSLPEYPKRLLIVICEQKWVLRWTVRRKTYTTRVAQKSEPLPNSQLIVIKSY